MSGLGLGTVGSRGHRARTRRFRGCLAVLVALAIIVGIGLFAYVKGVDAIKGWLAGPEDYGGKGHGSVVVQVRSGDTSSEIGAALKKADVVKSVQAFTDAAKKDERSLSIQVGYYRMHLQMSGAKALKLMLDPTARITTGVTIPEGLRAKEILTQIVAHTKFGATAVDKAFAGTKALGLPSYANNDAEGYLYPATYPVTPGTTPANLLQAMTARFDQAATDVELTAGAAALQMSPTDVVIVASLVQAEASRPQDMPKVARVIYNRLKIDKPLELDSTLHYAIDSRGVVQTTQHLRDLDTPYNSYQLVGLPPTAIDSPGQLALQAALHPAKGSWLYFVTVNLRTGDTRFATTFQDHLHNVALLHQYCETSKAC
ncbi:MAG: endolytic transglycosylase MltG [Actinomycetota bacterium]|nr:endolytic transglycosylase MltG [Actinomycetota bacterium]